jgi:hypothetical protein
MTEPAWMTCDNPKAMLSFLAGARKARDRQYRLFACACCRRVWPLMSRESARRAVEVTERHADGLASDEELEAAQRAACGVRELCGIVGKWASACAARTAAVMVVDTAGRLAACPPDQEYDPTLWAAETPMQCDLLRDVFGPLPFRPVPIASSWRTSEVLGLARAIYDERSFDRMLELGQALYRAGCNDRDLLQHCLWSGGHARGCWVIDLLLEKDKRGI